MLARQPQYRADSSQLTVAMPPDPEDVRYHDLAKDPQLQAPQLVETQKLPLFLGMLTRHGSIHEQSDREKETQRKLMPERSRRERAQQSHSRPVHKPNGSTKTCRPSTSCRGAKETPPVEKNEGN